MELGETKIAPRLKSAAMFKVPPLMIVWPLYPPTLLVGFVSARVPKPSLVRLPIFPPRVPLIVAVI